MVGYEITESGKQLLRTYIEGRIPSWITPELYDAFWEMAEALQTLTYERDIFTYDPKCLDERTKSLLVKRLLWMGYIQGSAIPDIELVIQKDEFKRSHPGRYNPFLED